jgi:hypothetical protein
MKAALSRRSGVDVSVEPVAPAEKPMTAAPSCSANEPLLREIALLGGDTRRQGAEDALKTFQTSLAEMIRGNPSAYGAGTDANGQDRVIRELVDSVSGSFLRRTVETLRLESGFVQFCGRWVHRAVFTFVGFGLIAAAVLPLCAVSLMSTSAWGWVPGALGIVAALATGAWILSHVRNRKSSG